MKKIEGYPCPKCKKLTGGTLIIDQYVNDRIHLVKFITNCCKTEFSKLFTKFDQNKYIKEVK